MNQSPTPENNDKYFKDVLIVNFSRRLHRFATSTGDLLRKSYFDADSTEPRDVPEELSESARLAIQATEVEEAWWTQREQEEQPKREMITSF